MKKILNVLTISILSSSLISSVISCDNNKNPYNSVTKDQEIYALNNFIQKNKSKLDPGFKFYDSHDNTDSIFNNHKEKNNIQMIDWTINSGQNSIKDNLHSKLKASYSGVMEYNLKTKNFTLDGDPFNNVQYIPGNFNPSLGVSSMICACNPYIAKEDNDTDFIIAASSGQLTSLAQLVSGDADSIQDVFRYMEWKNIANFPGLTLPDLKYIQLHSPAWQLTPGYMAIIHVQKINDQFQVVWSNLNNQQEKKSLPAGDIHSIFWKNVTRKPNSSIKTPQNHLWISKSLLTMIYQLKTNNLNQFLNNSASFFSWLNPIESISDIDQHGYKTGIQIAKNTTQTQKQYNTNQTELWDGINNLLTNWNSNQKKIKDLVNTEKYKAYDLFFDKNNNNWVFDKDDSHGMEQII